MARSLCLGRELRSSASSTGAMNLYPRRGKVSINRELSLESPRASRSFLMAEFRPESKSTNVSSGHNSFRSASRVTISPGRASRIARIFTGCPWSLTLFPCLRSSSDRKSSSNAPKRTHWREVAGASIRNARFP